MSAEDLVWHFRTLALVPETRRAIRDALALAWSLPEGAEQEAILSECALAEVAIRATLRAERERVAAGGAS